MSASELDALRARAEELERVVNGYQRHLRECEQIAGKALGYPWFRDDQENFPGATEDDGVCIGEHVGDTIVAELADAYAKVRVRAARAEAEVERLREASKPFADTPIPDDAKPHYPINYRPVTATYADVAALRAALQPKDQTHAE